MVILKRVKSVLFYLNCNDSLLSSAIDLGSNNHLLIQGRWGNLTNVLTWTCIPYGDGIDWKLRDGAKKYDLTVRSID